MHGQLSAAEAGRNAFIRALTQRRHQVEVNRVPDETKNLEDTICKLDTSYLLVALGFFKLLLVAPLLMLGILLIAIRSTAGDIKADEVAIELSTIVDVTTADVAPLERSKRLLGSLPTQSFYENSLIGNESIAPVWTALMLALSSGVDFIAVRRRRVPMIILYVMVATITFVACILSIEYDRIEIAKINRSVNSETLHLHKNLYVSCITFASIGVATGILTIYVGTRMAALEQHRLYLERDGLEAVLKKTRYKLPPILLNLAQKFSCSKQKEQSDSLSSRFNHNDTSSANHTETAADKSQTISTSSISDTSSVASFASSYSSRQSEDEKDVRAHTNKVHWSS